MAKVPLGLAFKRPGLLVYGVCFMCISFSCFHASPVYGWCHSCLKSVTLQDSCMGPITNEFTFLLHAKSDCECSLLSNFAIHGTHVFNTSKQHSSRSSQFVSSTLQGRDIGMHSVKGYSFVSLHFRVMWSSLQKNGSIAEGSTWTSPC